MVKNLYYFHSILEIGGIETFFYYLAKKYKDYDLMIVYQVANDKQLERLKKYVKCVQYTGQEFECERAFFNFNTDIIEHVHASNGYYLVIHGDYKDMVQQGQLSIENLPGHPKITNYIGVSQKACDSFKELTGHNVELCYNPFAPDKPEKILNLISATRLTREKGGKRILALADRMDELGIKYHWKIYSNKKPEGHISPNIEILKPVLNIQDYVSQADFLIQLSDNEGYCYSIVEAWNNGIPVVMTPLPVLKEIGANDTNSIILDFNLKNIDEVINTMINKTFNFKYIPKEDRWGELLIPGPSQYQEGIKYTYLVEALDTYEQLKLSDAELGYIPKRGFQWTIDKERFDVLMGENKPGKVFVKLIQKIPINKEDESI